MRLRRGSVELIFGLIASLAAASCLARPDYNLPLFSFMWWVFFHINEDRKERHQKYILILVTISCVQDLFYLIYWSSKWFSPRWIATDASSQRVHAFIIIFVILELILKAALLLILLARDFVDETTETIADWCTKYDEIGEYEIVTYIPTVMTGQATAAGTVAPMMTSQ
eukprot:Lankesteria_metandrocarpae@DN2121_c0_g1_i1.p1